MGVFVHVMLVFVGDCVCAGATHALRDVGSGLIFFGNTDI